MTATDTIDLYSVCLDDTRDRYDRARQYLSPDEATRASRFKFEHDRTRWSISRAALRLILGRHLKLHPLEFGFRPRSDGKPVLHRAAPDRITATTGPAASLMTPTIEFNLSHSRDRALIAVSRTLEVGCDVEHLGRVRDWPAVSRRFFSEAEQRELATVGDSLKERAFFLCWTRKEAIIKATGEGLRANLSGFDVSLTPGKEARVIEDRRDNASSRPWHLYDVAFASDYVGAVAARAPQPPRVEVHAHWRLEDNVGSLDFD